MALPDWSPRRPKWDTTTLPLLGESSVTLKTIIESSSKFPVKFPVQTGRCNTLQNHVSKDVLERNINSVYPIVHESALELYCRFIDYKSKHGSKVEKKLYKDMTVKDFVNRLLTKRAAVFVGKFDAYLLLDGTEGAGSWETIGTDKEKPPLVLKDCLSYDELKCSAFLSVSSYTYFVNIGDRKNMAKYTADRSSIEDEGVIVGLIGARLKKPNVMEHQEIIVTEEQNTEKNGYGTTVENSIHQLFSMFYEEECLTFAETKDRMANSPGETYTDLQFKGIFNNICYYKRMTISIDTLLMEANFRAKMRDTTAFVHVVGLGLGVWKISDHQNKVYMDTFYKRLKLLGTNLHNVTDVCFSYINQPSCGDIQNGQLFKIDGHPSNGIKIHIYNREPHSKLTEDPGKLLVVSYAWDGNALPGNEYWYGSLGQSGDSAAASSTQITELHNPFINPLVCADNLMVVTRSDVISLKEYGKTISVH